MRFILATIPPRSATESEFACIRSIAWRLRLGGVEGRPGIAENLSVDHEA